MQLTRWLGRALDRRLIICAAATLVLTSAFLIGGGTRQGLWQDAWLQGVAAPMLVLIALLGSGLWERGDGAWPVLLPCLVLAVPLLQIVPLPATLLQFLPVQRLLEEQRAELGASAWSAISVAPAMTVRAALSLLVPVAVFLGVWFSSYRQRLILSVFVIVWAVMNALLGLLQVSQGPASPLRFYTFTNMGDAVGFFANRNHLSAFINAAFPFLLVWIAHLVASVWRRSRRTDNQQILALFLAGAAALAVAVAQLTSRSRAGLLLFMLPLAAGSVFLLPRSKGVKAWRLSGGIFAAVGVFLLLAPIGLVERIGSDPMRDSRLVFARRTIDAVKASFPAGTGMGTFERVYPVFEKPADALLDAFTNRAHNDLLELTLESGIAGLAVLLLLCGWLLLQSYRIARHGLLNASELDRNLALAGFAACAVTLVHSLVDYPLRAGGVAALFAFSCAMLCTPPGAHLIPPPGSDGRRQRSEFDAEHPASAVERPATHEPAAAHPRPAAPAEVGQWELPGGAWPEAWKKR